MHRENTGQYITLGILLSGVIIILRVIILAPPFIRVFSLVFGKAIGKIRNNIISNALEKTRRNNIILLIGGKYGRI